MNLQNDGFTLYPGSGQQITYNPTQGTMLFFDHDLNGENANVTSFQQDLFLHRHPRSILAGLASASGRS